MFGEGREAAALKQTPEAEPRLRDLFVLIPKHHKQREACTIVIPRVRILSGILAGERHIGVDPGAVERA